MYRYIINLHSLHDPHYVCLQDKVVLRFIFYLFAEIIGRPTTSNFRSVRKLPYLDVNFFQKCNNKNV